MWKSYRFVQQAMKSYAEALGPSWKYIFGQKTKFNKSTFNIK